MLPTIQTQPPPDVIDLGLGDPPLSLLPLQLIRDSAWRGLARNDRSFLQYGAEQGNGHFIRALANFLTQGYGGEVRPESLFITNGISNALDLTCTLFTQAGDTIFVEEPSYFLALKIFADHRLNVIPIDTDENGLLLEALEEKLAEYRPRFLYLIPTFHNPSGATLTQERRERLIQLADEHEFTVVADEVYHLLSYAGQPPKSFGAYTNAENILSLGSFSKILAPGLRLGWLRAHPKTIKHFTACGLLDSGGGLNPFTSALIHEALETGGLEDHLNQIIQIYRARRDILDSALRQHIPQIQYTMPQGGYFLWARLPAHDNANDLRRKAPAFKVDFRPGTLFSSRKGLEDYVRLCFIHYEEAEIQEGVLRLKACLKGADNY
jgi:DNA-binding transcriptional MocR family regulator